MDSLVVDVTVSLQGIHRHLADLERCHTQLEANEVISRTTLALDTVRMFFSLFVLIRFFRSNPNAIKLRRML